MIQKKICMLGSFAVGKTCLVRRYVSSLFNERYHTTVGVKIDKKELTAAGQEVRLMLWDIHGEDEFQSVRLSYLRGASGYFLVADGTRRESLDRAYSLKDVAERTLGAVPFMLLLNKADLEADWEVTEADLAPALEGGWRILRTSAKSGRSVKDAFTGLAEAILAADGAKGR